MRKTNSDLCKIYKEDSMLGKYSCSRLFRLMKNPQNDVLAGLSKEKAAQF